MVRTRGALLVVGVLAALVTAAAVLALPRAVTDPKDAPGKPRTCRVQQDRSRPCRRAGHRPVAKRRATSRPRPALIKQSLVTSGADGDSSDGGNGWAPNKLRVVRSSTGALFSVYPSGPDTVNKTYNLMEFDQWGE